MIQIRAETPADAEAIAALTTEAFTGAPHSDGSEAAIIAALRAAGDLTLSLVAEGRGGLVGHAAFSPVRIEGATAWFGLGPVAVARASQGIGIGSQLIREGLARLQALGAGGCVVLGDPGYYGRFGFAADPALVYPGPPARYFQALAFHAPAPAGQVRYAPAFGA